MITGLLLPAALLAIQSPTQSQTKAGEQSTIVVTGKRNTDEDVRDFVKALTSLPPRRQLSRFEREICPVVVGLPRGQADKIATRMRLVATTAGISVGGKGCFPNVVLAVTPDKKAFIQELQRRQPNYFGSVPRQKVKDLVREPGPAAAWQLAGPPISARGTEVYFDPNYEIYVNRTTESASRITAPARPQFEAAVVVVEGGALAGLTTTQLADYAALRAFTAADPAKLAGSSAPTILRVLEAPMDSVVPSSLTHWDLAFLRGFYASPRNVTAASQRSSISKSVKDELNTGPE